MKKIMIAAHKMTREMVEKYGVDYQVQLGLNISYLLENKEEKEMTMKLIKKVENKNDFSETRQELVLVGGREKPWLATIKEFDDKYGFARNFVDADEIEGTFYSFGLAENIIYNWYNGKDQSFGVVEDGKLYEISKQDVSNLLNAR